MAANYIQKVAIIGAGGNLGKHFIEELLKTNKHTITALTRSGSTSILPSSIKTIEVTYDDDGQSLISALTGQQFLIITLSVRAPPDIHSKIVKAAVKAGVPYIMPNSYGYDYFNESLRAETVAGAQVYENVLEVERLGGTYIAMVCGMWYEWSLALGPQCFGFDFKNKKVIFYDDGETMINSSTWRQCGRALAGLLSLQEKDASPALADFKNKPLYLDSFKISQKDMFESVKRVTGTKDADWEIVYQKSNERNREGLEELKTGSMEGFAKAMYARVFYPGGGGEFQEKLANEALGLQKEDFDEATKRALEMVESGWNPFA